jgi:hypothetical protein
VHLSFALLKVIHTQSTVFMIFPMAMYKACRMVRMYEVMFYGKKLVQGNVFTNGG